LAVVLTWLMGRCVWIQCDARRRKYVIVEDVSARMVHTTLI